MKPIKHNDQLVGCQNLIAAITFIMCIGNPVSNNPLWSQSSAEPTKVEIESADVSALFIGNSHTAPIPKLLEGIFKRHAPKIKVCFAKARSIGFLASHAKSRATCELLRRGKWDYVVLQAQKYSTTGRYHYPYHGALKLSELATNQGTKIIMYPEWSRRGYPDEYLRINKIHQEISDQTGATVAPIGQTWKAVMNADPQVNLYAPDGNHASGIGSYLNAAVFFSLLSNKPFHTMNQENGNSSLKQLLGESSDKSNVYNLIHLHAWQQAKPLKRRRKIRTDRPSDR